MEEDQELERKAIEELLKEAKRGKTRAETMGPMGWMPMCHTSCAFLPQLPAFLPHPVTSESSESRRGRFRPLGQRPAHACGFCSRSFAEGVCSPPPPPRKRRVSRSWNKPRPHRRRLVCRTLCFEKAAKRHALTHTGTRKEVNYLIIINI
ncbi:dna-directed rna polymerases i and iii subunit [Lynx pardinus]|uniref:Dna-directed rna polymerases i and iii subunit n=1 Tax=Lynx pardinus TaxID=191816 RepID=A0A485MBG7_LYNPA|nr:dna-directed rna polymerases i and iii subunit [Lynx pardinus]